MRTKMAKLLLQFGFIRLQKSVFCGQHNEDQWNKCKSKLIKILKSGTVKGIVSIQ
ncbi:MAG: CRISPR-associated endonuclease Cas2 [Saprospiraceae bacterium]|nr:CRISPR-associated endonuclease Cas2 [Saprospiraceae bacterium]